MNSKKLPDDKITVSDMYKYGYTYPNMLPLSQQNAKELCRKGLEIFMLYEDDTDAAVNDLDDIVEHGRREGLFGIEQNIWTPYIEKKMEMETELFKGEQDMFGIYQLKPTSSHLRFLSIETLWKRKVQIDENNYELIYVAPIEDMDLEDIFVKFNIDQPNDYTGYSLSVSDVITIQRKQEITSFYVDTITFHKIPKFREKLLGLG